MCCASGFVQVSLKDAYMFPTILHPSFLILFFARLFGFIFLFCSLVFLLDDFLLEENRRGKSSIFHSIEECFVCLLLACCFFVFSCLFFIACFFLDQIRCRTIKVLCFNQMSKVVQHHISSPNSLQRDGPGSMEVWCQQYFPDISLRIHRLHLNSC